MRRIGSARRGEGGQALIMVLLGLAAILGFVAMTIDVGLIYEGRRQQQDAADAAAIAGASAFPDSVGAIARARDWAQRNGFVDGQNDATVTVNTPYNNDTSKIDCDCSV